MDDRSEPLYSGYREKFISIKEQTMELQNLSSGRRKFFLTLILLPIIGSLLFHLSPSSFFGENIW